jgi:hypothetical protein
MKLLRSWATEKGLLASQTDYIARTPQRQALRFTLSENPAIEEQYRTHWIESRLSEKTRDRLTEKASRAPDLVVIAPLNTEWKCHRCGGTGDLLIMENPGPACLRCVGLDDLYLQAMRSSLGGQRQGAKNPQWSCGSARLAAGMNDRGCWSRPRHWLRRSASSRRSETRSTATDAPPRHRAGAKDGSLYSAASASAISAWIAS